MNEYKLHTSKGKTYPTVAFANQSKMANIYKMFLVLCLVIVAIIASVGIILAVLIDSNVKPVKNNNGKLLYFQFCLSRYKAILHKIISNKRPIQSYNLKLVSLRRICLKLY